MAGLVLTPGASAGRDHSALVAIDRAVTPRGITVERVEFPGRAAGRRRPDPPAVCIQTVRSATSALARRLSVPTSRVAIGGRSFGGRMCSMAAAEGLDVAALVLVSYPLHPPGRPERLRTGTFPGPASAVSLRLRPARRLRRARGARTGDGRHSGRGHARVRRGGPLPAQERARGRRRRCCLAGRAHLSAGAPARWADWGVSGETRVCRKERQ